MKRQELALAVVVVGALACLVVVMFTRGGKPRTGHESIEIPNLSLAISGYVQDHGQPKSDQPIAALLVEGGYLDSRWVTDGLLLDRWGTPYAIFFAKVDGSDWHYSGLFFEWDGQTVSPDPSARVGAYPPMHQIISAGPDKKFGTGDDLVNW